MIRTVKQWLAEKKKKEHERSKKLLFPGLLRVNPLTGEINLNFPQKEISEDYFIGTRGEPSEIPISFKLK